MAWTVIDSDTSWQDLDVAQEIATAYNRRVAALSESEQTAADVESITPDEDMTVIAFILAVQTGIEGMATYYCDPDLDLSAVAGSFHSASTLDYADAQELFDAAGLTGTGGWRRIADAGSAPDPWTSYSDEGWSYGKIVDKDLAGPWLFKDIQLALSKMYRRIGSPDAIEGYYEASDDATNSDDPPVWPSLSPDAPDYAYTAYGSPILGSAEDGSYFIFASTSTSNFITAFARYTSFIGSNLIAGNASLKDIAVWVWVSSNLYSGPDDDFGTGYTLDGFNKISEKTGTTDTSISATTLPVVSSWAALLATVAMPVSGSCIYNMYSGVPLIDVVYKWTL